jgi:hypothetical protein
MGEDIFGGIGLGALEDLGFDFETMDTHTEGAPVNAPQTVKYSVDEDVTPRLDAFVKQAQDRRHSMVCNYIINGQRYCLDGNVLYLLD